MEKLDTLHINNYSFYQDTESFMFGIDAVLLADFAAKEIHRTDNVLDLGCGNGIIPLLLSGTSNAKSITGLEIQKKSFDLAEKNVKINNLEEKIQIINGNVREIKSLVPERSFSIVTTNPPYMPYLGDDNKTQELTIARQEKCATLEDFVKASAYALKPSGKLFMIHRPERLAEIITTLKKVKIEVKTLQLVYPFADKEATMVLIEARKDAKTGLKVKEPLIIYDAPGIYTKTVQKIYRKD